MCAERSLGGPREAAFFLGHQEARNWGIEARITVKEFATTKTSDMKFFATADIGLNQKTLKFHPVGWSETLLGALSECMRNLRKFEFEGAEEPVTLPPD